MSKRILFSLLPFLCLLILLPCFNFCKKQKADNRPLVAVSIEPLRYVVEAVAGQKWQVITLMPQGASPETYEPTPRQMASISHCTLLVRCGTLGFEQTQLPQMAKTTKGVKLISLSDGITPIEEEGHTHGSSAVENASSSIDPHLWMSPQNLSLMAANAAKALQEADPDNADYYQQRLQQFQKQMAQLDAQLKQTLASVTHRTFLIYHPALGYLAQQYSLEQLAVEHDGKDPSAAYMQQLVNRCKTDGVKLAFISKEHSGKAAQRIADEVGLKVVSINPLAYDVAEQMKVIAEEIAK